MNHNHATYTVHHTTTHNTKQHVKLNRIAPDIRAMTPVIIQTKNDAFNQT